MAVLFEDGEIMGATELAEDASGRVSRHLEEGRLTAALVAAHYSSALSQAAQAARLGRMPARLY